MTRKDDFKNHCEIEMTAWDANVPHIYVPKNRGKIKRRFRKLARRRMKQELHTQQKPEKGNIVL